MVRLPGSFISNTGGLEGRQKIRLKMGCVNNNANININHCIRHQSS